MIVIKDNSTQYKRILQHILSSITLFILLIAAMSVTAQSSLNTSGQTFTSEQGSVSLSIGQLFYQSTSNSNYTLTEGQQHTTFQIATTQISDERFDVSVYPNPTADYINIHCNSIVKPLEYTLYDITGKCHQSKNITLRHTKIDVQQLTPAIYYLTLRESGRIISNHKLIIQ